ncbi:hypothetical protein JH06_2409 [Blastocystis sp. subtype 4]|uniref:hypothetical protein n=1 Tax=Blastocystis sp. subtype 4 TaxID=944170 RepID=UPI000711BBDC|nr:hypothetical protein JH06_2409 [Blastocystis sp. subtype 4]KNB43981.1 hypothetical protein JH06_2409 [Blastocystis sp. subtype 4]|eukprot:XP_014527424.1 hypothetical protein JH06_2409 [Blastocystis sp. subtype 4]
MTEKGSEEAIEGLRNRIMKIVSDYQGNFSEIEILKQIMCESELLLATYNVRNLLTNNLDFCEESIRNEETEEVMPEMKKLADSAEVVSVSSTSDSEFCHTYATINFKISDTLTWQVMTVYDRVIIGEYEMMREDMKTKIHYVLKAGHIDGSLGDIIDFEFVHNGVYPPECDEGCDSCGSECDEEEDEDEVTGLSFDMDLMDLFTKESGISISSEDFILYPCVCLCRVPSFGLGRLLGDFVSIGTSY